MSLKEEIQHNFAELKSEAKNLLDANLSYYKLMGCKISSKALSMIVKFVVLGFILSLAVIFLSVAAGFALGDYFQNNALGFLVLGGIYLFVALLVFVLKKYMIDLPILKKLSKIFN